MRILAVSWRDLAHPLAGGSEVLVDRLLRELQARGHEVALVCGGPVGARPYPVHRAGGTFTQYLRAPLICATRLRHFDLVVDVENGVPFFSPLWRRRPSVCLVHHIHSDQWRTRFPPLVAAVASAVERFLIPLVYRNRLFVAVSQSTADALEGIGVEQRRIRVVENGIDVPSGPIGTESSEPLFVALSRLVPHKRVALLLEAWRSVQPVVGGRFAIIGDGPELTDLRGLAEGLPGAEMLGHIGNAERDRLLAEAWLLVHGSHHEGWGVVILEAAAAGTPTLAVDAPGVRDAVLDGVSGVLVHAREGELTSALSAAWIALAGDAGRRKRMGARARQRAGEFEWGRVVDAWEAVAAEALTGSQDRPGGREGLATPDTVPSRLKRSG
ncbi:MAG TPA: glycosyltransferase family 4 protein [Acidimicrobiales bacterium]|nr:glycosyltransferase family 4 protein [Acidimicrobiales bacterium]